MRVRASTSLSAQVSSGTSPSLVHSLPWSRINSMPSAACDSCAAVCVCVCVRHEWCSSAEKAVAS